MHERLLIRGVDKLGSGLSRCDTKGCELHNSNRLRVKVKRTIRSILPWSRIMRCIVRMGFEVIGRR